MGDEQIKRDIHHNLSRIDYHFGNTFLMLAIIFFHNHLSVLAEATSLPFGHLI